MMNAVHRLALRNFATLSLCFVVFKTFSGAFGCFQSQTMATTEAPPSCCSNPGCDQSGTSKCSACKTTFYCGPICQTAHWAHHKEECEGHLLKLGNAHLAKAKGFLRDRNYMQTLRYSDLALVKLNGMKKRPLEDTSGVLGCKCEALKFLCRHTEALQCAKDKYNLWAVARGPAHPSTIEAAFYLIDALLHNKEYEDAEFYARTLWEIIHNDIPGDIRQTYVAMAAFLLSQAIYRLAESGGIPPEEKQKAGEEAIAHARQALEIRTQLHGAESEHVAIAMGVLANSLDYFSDGGDDEVLHLYQQSIAIHSRVQGSTSMNVAVSEKGLGNFFVERAERARVAHDPDRLVTNLELALPHFREAARISAANNLFENASVVLRNVADVEENLRQIRIARAAVNG